MNNGIALLQLTIQIVSFSYVIMVITTDQFNMLMFEICMYNVANLSISLSLDLSSMVDPLM